MLARTIARVVCWVNKQRCRWFGHDEYEEQDYDGLKYTCDRCGARRWL